MWADGRKQAAWVRATVRRTTGQDKDSARPEKQAGVEAAPLYKECCNGRLCVAPYTSSLVSDPSVRHAMHRHGACCNAPCTTHSSFRLLAVRIPLSTWLPMTALHPCMRVTPSWHKDCTVSIMMHLKRQHQDSDTHVCRQSGGCMDTCHISHIPASCGIVCVEHSMTTSSVELSLHKPGYTDARCRPPVDEGADVGSEWESQSKDGACRVR